MKKKKKKKKYTYDENKELINSILIFGGILGANALVNK